MDPARSALVSSVHAYAAMVLADLLLFLFHHRAGFAGPVVLFLIQHLGLSAGLTRRLVGAAKPKHSVGMLGAAKGGLVGINNI